VRVDPDTTFLMITPMLANPFGLMGPTGGLPPAEAAALIDALIAVRPDHPGGYYLRGEYRQARGDARGALADYRKAKLLARADYPQRLLLEMQLGPLERLAVWEAKLPAVLRGEWPTSPDEKVELARYCADFEKRYALAARLAADAAAADPETIRNSAGLSVTYAGTQFMGWAIQAAAGNGIDAADLTDADRARLRRQALAWGRELLAQTPESGRAIMSYRLTSNPDLAPVRDPKTRAALPPAERDEWRQFWIDVKTAAAKTRGREVAPSPRAVGR
jgi:hypothetical protein